MFNSRSFDKCTSHTTAASFQVENISISRKVALCSPTGSCPWDLGPSSGPLICFVSYKQNHTMYTLYYSA